MAVVDFSHHNGDPVAHPILLVVSHIVAPVLLGAVVTTGLFYLMQSLIASNRSTVKEHKSVQLVDFVRVPKLTQVQTRDIHPRKPPPPEEMPPVKSQVNFNVAVDHAAFSMKPMKLDSNADLKGTWSFSSDGNYLPIVKVAPIYPTQAEMAGLEGWVVLQYTVDNEGRVVDAEVVDDCARATTKGSDPNDLESECTDQPNKIFDHAALSAARKFKYKPKVENGVPVATPHVRHKFVFVLAN